VHPSQAISFTAHRSTQLNHWFMPVESANYAQEARVGFLASLDPFDR